MIAKSFLFFLTPNLTVASENSMSVQGVSKVRGHFKKSILHPDFFILLSIFLQTLTNLIVYQFSELFYESDKKFVEINIFPPKGANLCRVCFSTFLPFL